MSRNVTVSFFFLAVFLLAGAYGLTFMLPKLFVTIGADEKYVGTMLMVTAVSTLLFVYYSGHLSDRLGRMNTLGMAGVLTALGLFLFGWAQSKGWVLALASASLGAGWGLIYTLAPVVLTRITLPEQRVRYFSMYSVFLMAGFGLSPVMASVMENSGFTVSQAFYVMSGLCLVGGILYFLLREGIKVLSHVSGPETRSSLSVASLKRVLSSKALLSIIMVWIGASVFAGMNNFQTVFADAQGLNYSNYFLAYTITVVICRILLAKFKGGSSPYRTIAGLQYVMFASIALFIFIDGSPQLYILVAILFGIGYGASYPVLAAMAANDANQDLVPQTIQLFSLTYFVGIFGFPLVAGWTITEVGVVSLLIGLAVLAFIEASLAFRRHLSDARTN